MAVLPGGAGVDGVVRSFLSLDDRLCHARGSLSRFCWRRRATVMMMAAVMMRGVVVFPIFFGIRSELRWSRLVNNCAGSRRDFLPSRWQLLQ